jgi:serine/threonine protein kinase
MIEYSEQQGVILQGILGSRFSFTLREYLEKQGSCIPLSKRLGWAHDIAVALHPLHASNVIHTDVKPENIFRDESECHCCAAEGSAVNSVRQFSQLSLWEYRSVVTATMILRHLGVFERAPVTTKT